LIFLQQNPSINSFDLYHPAWEYLKDSAKFQSITVALKSAPHAAERKGKSDVSKELSESNVAPLSAVTRAARPMGQKKSKRHEEEEKIAGNVVDAIRGSMQAGEGNNSASAVLAAALGSFTTLISESLKSWQEHQSYSNADPDLRKKYDNLLLTQRINAMEMASGTEIGGRFSTPIASHNNEITPAHAVAEAEARQQESGMVERNHNNKSDDGAVKRNNNAVVERNHNNNKSNDGAVERNNNAVIERNHNNKSEIGAVERNNNNQSHDAAIKRNHNNNYDKAAAEDNSSMSCLHGRVALGNRRLPLQMALSRFRFARGIPIRLRKARK
jgi:hypothetical protein